MSDPAKNLRDRLDELSRPRLAKCVAPPSRRERGENRAAESFAIALHACGLSQRAAARWLLVDERLVRDWMHGARAGGTRPRRRYARSGVKSWVYFIQQVGDGLIKIGFATDVDRRLDSLQTGSPVGLRVLMVLPGSRATEREMHQRFAAHHSHGEWFHPADELTAFIAAFVFEGLAPADNAAGLRADGGTFSGMWRCTRCGAARCGMGACPMCQRGGS